MVIRIRTSRSAQNYVLAYYYFSKRGATMKQNSKFTQPHARWDLIMCHRLKSDTSLEHDILKNNFPTKKIIIFLFIFPSKFNPHCTFVLRYAQNKTKTKFNPKRCYHKNSTQNQNVRRKHRAKAKFHRCQNNVKHQPWENQAWIQNQSR